MYVVDMERRSGSSNCSINGGSKELEGPSVVLQYRGGCFEIDRRVRDTKREVVMCSVNGGEEVRGCLGAVLLALAAKLL